MWPAVNGVSSHSSGMAVVRIGNGSYASLVPFQVWVQTDIRTWFAPGLVCRDAPDSCCEPWLQQVWTQPKAPEFILSSFPHHLVSDILEQVWVKPTSSRSHTEQVSEHESIFYPSHWGWWSAILNHDKSEASLEPWTQGLGLPYSSYWLNHYVSKTMYKFCVGFWWGYGH